MKTKTIYIFFLIILFSIAPSVQAQSAKVDRINIYPKYKKNKNVLVSVLLSLRNAKNHPFLVNCTLYQNGRVLKWQSKKMTSTFRSNQSRWLSFIFPHRQLSGWSEKNFPLKAEIAVYSRVNKRLLSRRSKVYGKKKTVPPPKKPKIWASFKNIRIDKRYRSKKGIEFLKITSAITIYYGKDQKFIFRCRIFPLGSAKLLAEYKKSATAPYPSTVWSNYSFYSSRSFLEKKLSSGRNYLIARISILKKDTGKKIKSKDIKFWIEKKKPAPWLNPPSTPQKKTPVSQKNLTKSLKGHPFLEDYRLDSQMVGEWLCFVLDEGCKKDSPVVWVFYLRLQKEGTGKMEISKFYFNSRKLQITEREISSIEILFWGVKLNEKKPLLVLALEEEEDLWGPYQLLKNKAFGIFFGGTQKRIFHKKSAFERIWPSTKKEIERELYSFLPYRRAKSNYWKEKVEKLQKKFWGKN